MINTIKALLKSIITDPTSLFWSEQSSSRQSSSKEYPEYCYEGENQIEQGSNSIRLEVLIQQVI